MNQAPLPFMNARWFSLTAIVLAAFLGGPSGAEAGLTLQSSSGSSTYGVYNTGGTSTGNFDGNNMLVYPGGGLPVLNSLVNGSSQTFSSLTLTPYFLSTVTNGPNGFGSAATEVYAANSGQQGSFTTQGGLAWSLKTKLADNLTQGSNMASVSFSTASAFYQNLGSAITITPGAILSVAGNLASSTSYVAASLVTTITVYSGENVTQINLNPIILASNGQVNIASNGGGVNNFASVTVSNGHVTGTGSSLASALTLQQYDQMSITSTLTLISDPGSDIGISDVLPSGLTNIPDFGSFASSDTMTVPEPSTVVLLGSGLVLAGLWNRSGRRNRSNQA